MSSIMHIKAVLNSNGVRFAILAREWDRCDSRNNWLVRVGNKTEARLRSQATMGRLIPFFRDELGP
jgi:hypothetical protein